jgi:hypothetical protein
LQRSALHKAAAGVLHTNTLHCIRAALFLACCINLHPLSWLQACAAAP